MCKRTIVVATALASVVLLTTPALASIGTNCGGWKTMAPGAWQNACSIRSANGDVAGRGKGYYDGYERLDQLDIMVTLQASADGTRWSSVASRSCGFTDVPDEPPGGLCTTAARDVEVGMLYRTRAFLVLFFANGVVTATSPVFSPITT
jgi:hypothetical protein